MRCIVTARHSGGPLAEQPAPPAATQQDVGLARVWVDTTRRFQSIEGFGGAFTEAAAVTWQKLGAASQQAVLRACFTSSPWPMPPVGRRPSRTPPRAW